MFEAAGEEEGAGVEEIEEDADEIDGGDGPEGAAVAEMFGEDSAGEDA